MQFRCYFCSKVKSTHDRQNAILVIVFHFFRGWLTGLFNRFVPFPFLLAGSNVLTVTQVFAGSADELEHQQGMAHLVEHVAYMGSRKRWLTLLRCWSQHVSPFLNFVYLVKVSRYFFRRIYLRRLFLLLTVFLRDGFFLFL